MSPRLPSIVLLTLALCWAWQSAPSVSGSQDAPTDRIVFDAYDDATQDIDIYSINAEGGVAQNLTNLPGVVDSGPAWSPDGTRIAFNSARGDAWRIWIMNTDGSNPQPVADGGSWPTWSPDGKRLAYQCQSGICASDTDGGNQQTIIPAPSQEGLYSPQWSPDGTRIAVISNKTGGTWGIATFNAQGGDRVQLTDDGGWAPSWSPDGSKIMYKTRDYELAIVDVATKATEVVAPSVLSRGDWSPDGKSITYAVEGNGLWVANADGSNPVQITQMDAGSTDWKPAPRLIHSVEFTQAIQEMQTVSELRADLAADGQPPVPLVAGKPAAIRVHFNELEEDGDFIVESNVSEYKVVTHQSAGCKPEDSRRRESPCDSPGFDFLPPEGEWTAEVIVKDASGGVLEEHSFDFNTPRSQALVLVAISVCDNKREDGGWDCGDEADVVGNANLLRLIAPTDDVRVIKSRHVIHRQHDGADGRAWFNAVVRDLENLAGLYPGDVVVPGERRILVGAVRGEGPEGLLGVALFDSFAAVAKTETATLGRDDSKDTLAHEVGHALGIQHTNTGAPQVDTAPGCYDVAADEGTDWPYADNFLRSGTPPGVIEVGYDVDISLALPGDKILEVMGYCGPSWISPRTSRLMGTGINGPMPLGLAATGHPRGAIPQGAAGEYWLVSGTISGGAAAIDPLFRLEVAGTTATGAGAYRVEVRDGAGAVLFTRSFDPAQGKSKPEPGWPDYEGVPSFSEVVPVQAGAASVAVVGPGDAVLGQVGLAGTAPSVSFDPMPATPIAGTQTISWSITDPDSADHVAWLEYSADNGATWHAIAAGLADDSLPVDFDSLPGGGQVLLRVTVSDGANSGSTVTSQLSVTEKEPQAVISAPESGAMYAEGRAVVLHAAAYDAEDGALDGATVTWTSSRDGFLGTGANLAVFDLSKGVHTITMSARDSDANSASDSVTVTVFEAPIVGGEPAVLSGDVDCSGAANAIDALKISRHVAALSVAQTEPCPDIGTGGGDIFGDVNCDGSITAVDALFVLRFVAALPVNLPQGCRQVGT